MTGENFSIDLKKKLKEVENNGNKNLDDFLLEKKSLIPFISQIEDIGLCSFISQSYYAFIFLLSFLGFILTCDYFLKNQSWIYDWTLMLSLFAFVFYPGKIQTKS